MKKYLRKFNEHRTIASIDLKQQEINYHNSSEIKGTKEIISGIVCKLGGNNVLFFRDEEDLFIGEINNIIKIPQNPKVTLSKIRGTLGRMRRLTINSDSGIVFSKKYIVPFRFPPAWLNNTAFDEEEFHDPGLFIHNILVDSQRAVRAFRPQ